MEKAREKSPVPTIAAAIALIVVLLPAGVVSGAAREIAGAVGLSLGQKIRLLGISREANRLYPSGKWPKFREGDFSGALNQGTLRAVFAKRIRYRKAAMARIMYVNKKFYSSLDSEQKRKLVEQLRVDSARKRAKRARLANYERRWFRITYERMGITAARRPGLEAARIRMAGLRARSFAAGRRHAARVLEGIRTGRPIDADLVRMNREMHAHEVRVARAKISLMNLFNAKERRAVLSDFTNMMNKRNL